MDYSIILVFTTVLLAFAYNLYYTYFKIGAKISDKQLMQNYIILQMKQDRTRMYFPKMEIKYE